MPTRTSHEVELQALVARCEHREGPDALVPRSGAGSGGVTDTAPARPCPTHLREYDPITCEVIRSSKLAAVSYERPRPGERATVHSEARSQSAVWSQCGGRGTTGPRRERGSARERSYSDGVLAPLRGVHANPYRAQTGRAAGLPSWTRVLR